MLSLKKWVMKMKVKKIKQARLAEFRRYQLLKRALTNLNRVVRIMRPINEDKKRKNELANEFADGARQRKVISRLKKHCYRCRVYNYIHAKTRHALIVRYMEIMKEKTI